MSVWFFVFAEAAGCVLTALSEQMIQLMLPTKNATVGKRERDESGTGRRRSSSLTFLLSWAFHSSSLSSSALILLISSLLTSA